jgi:hypothetical protein
VRMVEVEGRFEDDSKDQKSVKGLSGSRARSSGGT